jgi:hypothetical protein
MSCVDIHHGKDTHLTIRASSALSTLFCFLGAFYAFWWLVPGLLATQHKDLTTFSIMKPLATRLLIKHNILGDMLTLRVTHLGRPTRLSRTMSPNLRVAQRYHVVPTWLKAEAKERMPPRGSSVHNRLRGSKWTGPLGELSFQPS